MATLKIVSIETAKLLRKLRFNEPTPAHYDPQGNLVECPHDGTDKCWNSPAYDKSPRHQSYAAPALALAQQWLREKKRFDVLVEREYFLGKVGKYYAHIYRLRDGAMSETPRYRSYEKALEAGIIRALKAAQKAGKN